MRIAGTWASLAGWNAGSGNANKGDERYVSEGKDDADARFGTYVYEYLQCGVLAEMEDEADTVLTRHFLLQRRVAVLKSLTTTRGEMTVLT